MTTTDKCQIRQGGYWACKCSGEFPHAPGWQDDTEVYAPVTDPGAFDHRDRLNDDGTVTVRIIPSNWRRYNISPDTYQSFNGDSWVESTIEYLREETGRDLGYDDINWTYDHKGIVRDLAEELSNWLSQTLMEAGLESLRDVKVVDSWSPAYYNFTSDGWEVELTFDPIELRELTPDFDVDDWGHEWYRSVDGFMSYVTSRLNDDTWHADYDAEFRIESLLSEQDSRDDESWFYWLLESEWEVYDANVKVEVIEPEPEYFLDTQHTLEEWEDYAHEIHESIVSGMSPLFT